MIDREQYTPGPAYGAQVRKDGGEKDKDKWTLILVRELRHSPETAIYRQLSPGPGALWPRNRRQTKPVDGHHELSRNGHLETLGERGH